MTNNSAPALDPQNLIPGTRVELLKKIQGWVQDDEGVTISKAVEIGQTVSIHRKRDTMIMLPKSSIAPEPAEPVEVAGPPFYSLKDGDRGFYTRWTNDLEDFSQAAIVNTDQLVPHNCLSTKQKGGPEAQTLKNSNHYWVIKEFEARNSRAPGGKLFIKPGQRVIVMGTMTTRTGAGKATKVDNGYYHFQVLRRWQPQSKEWRSDTYYLLGRDFKLV